MIRFFKILGAIVCLFLGWDATAQVTAAKPASGSVFNCSDPQAPAHAYIFTGDSGTTLTDIGCSPAANMTLSNSGGHISFVDDGTFGRVLQFTGANTTDYASVASNLGASTSALIGVAFRVTSATNPAAIGFLADFGSSSVASRYGGMEMQATNGKIAAARDDETNAAVILKHSDTDYADNAVHIALIRIGTSNLASTSVDGSVFNGDDVSTMGFSGLMNQFGIGAKMAITKTNFLGDASVNTQIVGVFEWPNNYAAWDDAYAAAIYNSGDIWAGMGLGGCVVAPTVTDVDTDEVVGEAQKNVAFTVTNGCSVGTITLEQAGGTKTLTQHSYTPSGGTVDFSGVGWKTAGNLLYGPTQFCDTNTAGKGCLAVDIYPESDHPYAFQSAGPAVKPLTAGASLLPTAPPVWPDGSKTLVFTNNRSTTDGFTADPTYTQMFLSEEEAISAHCHVKLPGETTIPAFTWAPSTASKTAVAIAITGGPASCDGLAALIQLQPRDQALTEFPWPAATVASDGAMVIKFGGKDKTVAGNGITYDVSPGFTRFAYSATAGTSQVVIGEYQIQNQHSDITAGSWTVAGASPVPGETDQTNAITIVLNGDAPICYDFTSGSKLPLAYDSTYGYFNRLFGFPIDISVPGSQVTVASSPVAGGVELNGDLSLVINSLVSSYQYNFSNAATDLYLGPPATVEANNPGPLYGGVAIPNQIYAVGVPVKSFSVASYFTLGVAPLSAFTYRRLVSPTLVTQANGTGVNSDVLIVDSITGLNKKDWIKVGTSYSQIKYLNPFTKEIGLYFHITWADNDAVSTMSLGTCSVAGISLDPTTGLFHGTPSVATSQDLCFFRETAADGSFADSR